MASFSGVPSAYAVWPLASDMSSGKRMIVFAKSSFQRQPTSLTEAKLTNMYQKYVVFIMLNKQIILDIAYTEIVVFLFSFR